MRFKRPRGFVIAIILAVFILILWPAFASFYTSLAWYRQLGYELIFTTEIKTKFWLGLIAGLVAGGVLFLNLKVAMRFAPEALRPTNYIEMDGRQIPTPNFVGLISRFALPLAFVVGLVLALQAASAWQEYLRFRHQVPFGQAEPLFGRDIAFYVFSLPFFEMLTEWLFTLAVVTLIALGLFYLSRGLEGIGNKSIRLSIKQGARRHLFIIVAVVLLVLAATNYLELPNLLFSAHPPIAGAAYTDIHARLPLIWTKVVTSLIAAAVAAACAFGVKTRLLWGALALHVIVIGVGVVYPSLLQRVSVLPNEFAKETPYITRNIAATRKAFGLDQAEERELTGELTLTAKNINDNRATIKSIRLWDQKQLLDTFAQIQEFRTYYDFVSVDNDRYIINGELQQVMLSARELSASSLQNRNWINERLTFTHGYGLALGPVDQVTPEGMPLLFVKDIPPKSTVESLAVTRPEIYFGELANEHVYVRTRAKEFDYPSGEQNVFSTYTGSGGVGIGSIWRRLMFATRFGDSKLVLSDDMTPESRVLFHRNIRERLSLLAPFLRFDSDPYLVIKGGELFWIADAYTTTDRYPYSQPAADGINYIRNSVKAIIDAYNGNVTFYVADDKDPLIATYSKIFPGVFKPLAEMPTELRSHLRYPEDIFRIQTAVYSTYHMDEPQVFYNKEDQWTVAAMRDPVESPDPDRQAQSHTLDPYYTVMKLPGESGEEFILMLPFTPQRKDNLASWMVARSDEANYGKLVVYRFPKQSLVFGPKQVVARINQDPEISRQLSLWNQRGSQVILGTPLVIPIEQSLLYIQPLYLRAESGKIPELRRVIVATDKAIAMESTLAESINRLFGEGTMSREKTAAPPSDTQASATPVSPRTPLSADRQALIEQALESYKRAEQAQRNGDWAQYGEELKRLGQALEKLKAGQEK